MLLEPFRPRSPIHSASNGGDESVDSFFSRRFGKNLAERMLSAMIHGIYAGDTRRLSMRAVFPGLWEAEREWGSVIMAALFGGLWRRRGWAPKSPYRLNVEREAELEQGINTRLAEAGAEGLELVESMQSASVWGVRGGLARLTEQLKSYLEQQGVEVMTGTEATVSRKGNQWTVSRTSLKRCSLLWLTPRICRSRHPRSLYIPPISSPQTRRSFPPTSSLLPFLTRPYRSLTLPFLDRPPRRRHSSLQVLGILSRGPSRRPTTRTMSSASSSIRT